jgi:NAD-reducing hydrogenase large subunit
MHDIHVIDPVSRIEGHAKITLHLDADGQVADARFHVTEFRGFEEFCRGRPLAEMPALTARTCGICPVSHLLASAKATDAIMAVTVPPAALLQRSLANLGQIVQSHVLSFFHLSAPDLLLGMESDPATRNVFGLMASEPEVVRRGIRLRQFGQEVIASVAGERIHGKGIVPGGVAHPFTVERRDALRGWLDEAHAAARDTLHLSTELLDRFADEVEVFGRFPSLYLGHRGADGTWEHHEGTLTVLDHDGSVIVDGLDPARYREVLGEAASADSYLKVPYWRDRVTGDDPSTGMYRVGPLARVNLAERFGTPLADAALADFRERVGRIASSSFHYHHARILEVVASIERIAVLLDDPVLLDEHVRAHGGINQLRGVGASEAPRGTLFHDYEVDQDGIVTGVNLIIATGQNELAMNRTIRDIARAYITGPTLPEGVLNRIEAGIRAYDPCLSCSTHALGQMPLAVELLAPDGEVVCERHRGAS